MLCYVMRIITITKPIVTVTKSVSQPYPGEEFIVTGSHMTSRNQGSFSKQERTLGVKLQ